MTLWGRFVGTIVMVVGITTYGMVTATLTTWFVGREQRRRHRLSRDAHELGEEGLRFDRMERLLAARSEDR